MEQEPRTNNGLESRRQSPRAHAIACNGWCARTYEHRRSQKMPTTQESAPSEARPARTGAPRARVQESAPVRDPCLWPSLAQKPSAPTAAPTACAAQRASVDTVTGQTLHVLLNIRSSKRTRESPLYKISKLKSLSQEDVESEMDLAGSDVTQMYPTARKERCSGCGRGDSLQSLCLHALSRSRRGAAFASGHVDVRGLYGTCGVA